MLFSLFLFLNKQTNKDIDISFYLGKLLGICLYVNPSQINNNEVIDVINKYLECIDDLNSSKFNDIIDNIKGNQEYKELPQILIKVIETIFNSQTFFKHIYSNTPNKDVNKIKNKNH